MIKSLRRAAVVAAAVVNISVPLAHAADPIRIGISVPITGPSATFTDSMRKAGDLAAKQVNDKGGILGGRKLELIYEDDKGTPAGGVAAAQKLMVQDRVAAIGGGSSSSVVLAQSAVTKGKVLHLVSGAQADSITDQGSPYLLAVMTTATSNAKLFNPYITGKLKPKTAAFLGDNGEYAKTHLEALKKDLAAANIKLVDVSLYDAETRDFTSLLTRVKSLGPDMLFVADVYPARYIQLWKQVRQVGGFPIEVMAASSTNDVVLGASGGALDGVYTANIYMPGVATGSVGKAFIDDFNKSYGYTPGQTELIVYETVQLLAAGMDKAGSATDYPKITAALKAQTWTTPRGNLKFDSKGRSSSDVYYIQQIKNNKLTLVETQQVSN